MQYAPSTVHYQGAARSAAARLGFFSRVVKWKPHPTKADTGGEDAYLATDFVLGVADGVGWWRQNGVDAGQYSEALMRGAYNFTVDEFQGDNCVPCIDMLKYAYEDASSVEGTSTALLASLCDNRLEIASVGDCSLLLIRDGEIVYRTEEQTHGLNFPYQLGSGSKDKPQDAYRAILQVQEGDLVVMGSDGIFDNVFDNDVVRILREEVHATAKSAKLVEEGLVDLEHTSNRFNFARWHTPPMQQQRVPLEALVTKTLDRAAEEIMKLSKENSCDLHVPTPFSDKCMEGGMIHDGGKMDDMTLIVSTISQDAHFLGERVVQHVDSLELAPPYKHWP